VHLDPIIHQRTARVAERHFGYITRTQAYAVGHTEASLRDRSGRSRLEQVNVRLFRVRGAPRSWQGDVYAATAACPPGALASAMSVAALFGACPPPTLPHLLVPRGMTPRGVLAVVHRGHIDPLDVTTFGVIPITAPSRVPIDCAALLRRDALDEVVDALFTAGLTDREQVLAAIARSGASPGRKNIPELVASMEVWHPGMTHDSVAEARLFRLVVSWGFPLPEALHVIRTADGEFVCEVDAAWPDAKVALDYDSVAHHGPRRWPRDEARIAAAVALGWHFIPVDKSDVAPAGQGRLRSELATRLAPAGAPIPGAGPALGPVALRRARPSTRLVVHR
jgi:hypothetical protein